MGKIKLRRWILLTALLSILFFLNANLYADQEVLAEAEVQGSDSNIPEPTSPNAEEAPKPEEPPQADGGFMATPIGAGPASYLKEIQADIFTGTANTGIPIEVISGRKGLQPNLALSYNSNLSNGLCGAGWSLELSTISRSTKAEISVVSA